MTNATNAKERRAWLNIQYRCCVPTDKAFSGYGARGIVVCERWLESFEAFLADVGPAPSLRHTIGRIDNNGNYEPGNVRWELPVQQANNKRTSRRVVLGELKFTISEFAASHNIPRQFVYERTRGGATGEDIRRDWADLIRKRAEVAAAAGGQP